MTLASVLRLGLCTPLGLNAATSLAAAESGIVRFEEIDRHDRRGAPIRVSMLSTLAARTRTERVAALAGRAARDGLTSVSPGALPSPLPLYLALPERDDASLDASLVAQEIARCSPAPVELREVVHAGRAGMFQLLQRLAGGPDAPALALVVAADSLCDEATLAQLARTALADRIPGEAAAALLVARGEAPGRPSLARVLACTSGQVDPEAGRIEGLADGLTDVVRRLGAAGGERARCVSSCQTGEVDEARAFSYAALRCAPVMPEPLVHLRACESFGDVGAAAPGLALALALAYTASGRALLYGSGDGGQLGACLVEVTPSDDRRER